ncbi:TPA: WYL domain-containing protein [Burkholderia vietnamiensis]|uniref:helix-turn-helix transcriptional regulator n=1 Tax=Burkholderia pseudomallei TaxID=28450 RepID=UPI000F050FE5|nr:WYL domain-containing protein [Burkholderia pseudomallei]HDR9152714.1 WYL domain-containing protein [Burkholderia vietnamiensis]
MTTSSLDEAILRILPTDRDLEPWMPTSRVFQLLEDRGHRVDYLKQLRRRLSMLERDLLVLSTVSGRHRLWQRKSWLHGANQVASLMSASEAVAFHALRRFVGDKLPAAVIRDIEPLFKAADTRLSQDREDSRLYRAWGNKIDVVEPTFALDPPSIDPDVFQTVVTATFFERELHVRYRQAYREAKTDDVKLRRLWPLALVESAGLVYMIAQSAEHPPRPDEGKPNWLRTLFRLDRIISVVDSGIRFAYPRDFRLHDTIANDQVFEFLPETPVVLELALEPTEAKRLGERRMSKDQKLELLSDGRTKVTGTVVPSVKLRRWLRSLGPAVEILAPTALRNEFARDAAALAKRYNTPA